MKKITYIPPVATVHATTEIISILANTKYRQTTENVEDVEDVWQFALLDERVKNPVDFTIDEEKKE